MCGDKLCKLIFEILENPLLHRVFHLTVATLSLLTFDSHVKIHTGRATTEEEIASAEFKSQYQPPYDTPEAMHSILQSSTEPYNTGEKTFASACVHSYTVDPNPVDHWEFQLDDPNFKESDNTPIGRVKTPTGDEYTLYTARSIYRREDMVTTYPDGVLYDSTNTPVGSYEEVFNRDLFKYLHRNSWQRNLDKYKAKDAERVEDAKKIWRFTKNKREENHPDQPERIAWERMVKRCEDDLDTFAAVAQYQPFSRGATSGDTCSDNESECSEGSKENSFGDMQEERRRGTDNGGGDPETEEKASSEETEKQKATGRREEELGKLPEKRLLSNPYGTGSKKHRKN